MTRTDTAALQQRGRESARTIGVGLIGTGFMGVAHAWAYRAAATMMQAHVTPDYAAVAGRNEARLEDFALRFGFREPTTDWRELVANPAVTLVDNVGPNALHAEPTVAAARAGKHVICEKPLGRTAREAFDVWQAVAGTGVVHMCAFNYRFVPAIRKLRELITAGAFGQIVHFRARYLQDWLADAAAPATWRMDAEQAGSGALGDLGAHIADLARYLVGEVSTVTGALATFTPERPGGAVTVDDAFAATVRFEAGAIGTLEASRCARGHANDLSLEINGTEGSARFSLERLNELELDLPGGGDRGFRRVLVTEPTDPFLAAWWPPGHVLGWEHTFAHELHHLLECIATGTSVTPHGADLEDGYRAAVICDAIARAHEREAAQDLTAFDGAQVEVGP